MDDYYTLESPAGPALCLLSEAQYKCCTLALHPLCLDSRKQELDAGQSVEMLLLIDTYMYMCGVVLIMSMQL